jgi:hypothetical protein
VNTFKRLTSLLVLLFVASALLAIAPAQAAKGPWVRNPTNGHLYKAVGPMTWAQAEAQAVELGGHLVTVNDADEYAWLLDHFGAPDFSMTFVIGYNDIENEGDWVWSSGETPGFSDWCPYEPNNADLGEDIAIVGGYPFDGPMTDYC